MKEKVMSIIFVTFLILSSCVGAIAKPPVTTANNGLDTDVGPIVIPIIQNSVRDIQLQCLNSTNEFCPTSTVCKLSIQYPNGSFLINDSKMTWHPYYYNYTLKSSKTTLNGQYSGLMTCQSPKPETGFTNLQLFINNDGIDLTGGFTVLSVIGIFLALILIFFLVMMVTDTSLRLLWGGLSAVLMPIIMSIATTIFSDSFMPPSIINIATIGYGLSSIFLGGYIFYIAWKLIMRLKIRNNTEQGAKTSETLIKSETSKKEKPQEDYKDTSGEFEDDG